MALVANYRALPVRSGSIGEPVPGWDVDMFDDEGAVRRRGRRRRASASPTAPVGLFDGYVGDADANDKSLRDGRFTPAIRPGATATAICGSRAATMT